MAKGGGGGGGGTQTTRIEAPIYLQQNRALQGSPVTGAAQDYVTRSLQGGFLGSNPYLDQTFNRAALQTQNQLASEFARSGRSVDASEGLRSQQLNDLANQIYGGAYGQERQLMQGTLPFAQGLANQDYFDIGQLRGVGSEVENLAGQYANAPGANFDAYLSRILGNGQGQSGSTQQIDQSRNRGAGALGGGLLGASLAPAGALAWPYALGGAILGGIF
jgi:hypothetical protein